MPRWATLSPMRARRWSLRAGGSACGSVARPSLNLSRGPEFVVFELRDTGPGVSKTVLSSMAEPFFTTKPVGKGSGLGLSMVKGFAEQLGGGLHLRNHPEGGLVASLLLPVASRDESLVLTNTA